MLGIFQGKQSRDKGSQGATCGYIGHIHGGQEGKEDWFD